MLDSSQTAIVVVALAATYLLHSTVFFVGTWIAARFIPRRHALLETAWRGAAVLGLFTAPAQLALAPAVTQWDLMEQGRLAAFASPSDPQVTRNQDQTSRDVPERTRLDGLGDPRPQTSPASDTHPIDAQRPRLLENVEAAASELAANSKPTRKFAQRVDLGVRERIRSLSTVWELHWRSAIVPVLAMSLLGLLLLAAARVAVQEILFQRRLSRSVSVRGPVRQRLDQLLAEFAIRRRVRLLAANEFVEPAACGVWRWTILVPEDLGERVGDEELRALLTHELAHLVRGDTRWLVVGRFLCAGLCFQPLNFLARRRWREESEYLCDDWTVSRGVAQLTLARVLTEVVEWKLDDREGRLVLAASGAHVARRVRRLLAGERTPDPQARAGKRRSTIAAVAIAVLAVVAAPGVAVPHRAVADSASRPSAAKANAAIEEPWRELEAELLALERELHTAHTLAVEVSAATELPSMAAELEERASMLSSRIARMRAAAEQQQHPNQQKATEENIR